MNALSATTSGVPANRSKTTLSVLVVSHVGTVWGAQRRLLDLAPLLGDLGVHLTLACPEGELSGLWLGGGHAHESLHLPVHRGLRRSASRQRPGPGVMGRELGAVMHSAAVIARRARRFDVVQSHSLWAHLETAVAGRIARRPVVLDLHDIVDEGAGRAVLRLAARLATTTLANSAATASTVAGSGSRTEVVHPGVDLDRFHPGPVDPRVRSELTADPSAPLVAIIGRVDPNKGVDVLVRAVEGVTTTSVSPHLAVIGREHIGGAEQARALRADAVARLGDRVRFLAPRDDIPAVLRSVDVLVNASRHEPFGRTVLEAQACGVAVVGTAAGGIPEFVRDGETGLLVPPFDVDALTYSLRRLIGDLALRARLGAAAAEQARSRFSVEAQAAAAANVYRQAAGR